MTKHEANQMEAAVLRQLGARRCPCSGALAGWKGDGTKGRFLIDVKATRTGRHPVTVQELVKVNREAIQSGKEPALVLHFEKVALGCPHTWALVPAEIFSRWADETDSA